MLTKISSSKLPARIFYVPIDGTLASEVISNSFISRECGYTAGEGIFQVRKLVIYQEPCPYEAQNEKDSLLKSYHENAAAS